MEKKKIQTKIKGNYEKLLGSLVKKGNKVAARRILTNTLITISKKKRVSTFRILSKVFKKLENHIEVKRVTWGKGRKARVNLIPFPLKPKRQKFLKVKWLVGSAREDRKKVDFSEKLSAEMWNLLYDKKKSKALAKKKETRRLVLANRSNSHFRW